MPLFFCFTGLSFSLRGKLLSNTGSRVYIGDIGEGNSALFCLTDREACCIEPNRRGAWRFPGSSSDIPVGQSSPGDFYAERGSSSLQLNRRNNAIGPTGTYSCLLPSASNNAGQTITIDIFGKWIYMSWLFI